MGEHPSDKEKPVPTREQVVNGFRKFAQGITNPDDLLYNSDAKEPSEALDNWYKHQQSEVEKSGTKEAEAELNFSMTTIYVDAGFSDLDYLNEVISLLDQDLQNTEAEDLPKIEIKIKDKIAEIKAKLAK